jgi:peptidylprolyl isomerase
MGAMSARIVLLLCVALISGCGEDSASSGDEDSNAPRERPPGTYSAAAASRERPKIEAPSGAPPKQLVIKDQIEGDGVVVRRGDDLAVRFVSVRYVNGKHFETIWDKPFRFTLGSEDVSPGWVKGLPGMRVGGRRQLIVPYKMISRFGVPPESGPEDTLVYVIDLLEAR